MTELFDALAREAGNWSALEGLAVACAVAYLLLAIRQHIACWLFAGLSTAIYIGLFADVRLYMEAALNAFYFAMAVYGWWTWSRGGGRGRELPVTTWPVRRHALALAVLVLLSGASGWMLSTQTDAIYPYLDSMTTWSAVWATFLVARKVLENWHYWFAIDAVSMALYWDRGLALTTALFLLYLVMIPFGYVGWRRSMQGRVA